MIGRILASGLTRVLSGEPGPARTSITYGSAGGSNGALLTEGACAPMPSPTAVTHRPPTGQLATVEAARALHPAGTGVLDRVFPPDQCHQGPPTASCWSTSELDR